jgi:ferredoxin-NADP reductase
MNSEAGVARLPTHRVEYIVQTMLKSSTTVWLGIAFVLVGAINVWLILQASTRVRDGKANTRLIAAHRIGGYLFIAVYCVMGYVMVPRLGDVGGDTTPGSILHLTLAMALGPLLLVKVLIARYCKSYYSFLLPIGLVIFVLSFVLVGIAAGPHLARKTRTQTVSSPPDQPAPRSAYDGRMIVFVSVVCMGMLTLIIRKPAKNPATNAKSVITAGAAPERAGAVRVAASAPSEPLILRLVSITAQTPDSKTLRFILSNDRKLNARPGQFLTFSFLFDGKKVVRSYSICSSPARTGYVEITAKRVSQGCVSVFLNDRASVGMTVEANGAFGQFCFDESKHQSVVLIAAGSGITPMMAMLRYIDDLCLETSITLLYCVRTSSDIIFERELEQLRSRMKNFQYHVLLSQPHAEWPGPRGHVSREFIENTVKDIVSPDYFLCGPPAFMEASRGILTGLGVKPERIRKESFGSSVPKNAQPDSVAPAPDMLAEFVRSGKTCTVRSGQTLLEAAEEHGVGIPSSCRQGQCGTCKTKLLGGNVRMDAEDGLDPDSRAQGFVLLCVGHADGAVKLDA